MISTRITEMFGLEYPPCPPPWPSIAAARWLLRSRIGLVRLPAAGFARGCLRHYFLLFLVLERVL